MDETRKPTRKPRAKVAARPAARTAATGKAPPARKTVRAATAAPAVPAASTPAPGEREQRVRMAAYFRAERRGFAAGYEWEDWLAAEAEVGPAPEAKLRRTAPAKKAGS